MEEMEGAMGSTDDIVAKVKSAKAAKREAEKAKDDALKELHCEQVCVCVCVRGPRYCAVSWWGALFRCALRYAGMWAPPFAALVDT